MGFNFVGMAIMGAVSIGAAFLMRPRIPDQKTTSEGPRLKDLTATNSEYGVGIPRIWGTYALPGNIIWMGPVNEHKNVTRTTTRVGGKGSSSSKQTHTDISYTYSVSLAVGLGRGKLERVIKILMDNQVVFDITGASVETTVPGLRFTFYPGDEEQLPDPIIAAHEGHESTPAHRGLSYVVFDELDITTFGNRIPQFQFIVKAEGGAQNLVKPFRGHGSQVIDWDFGRSYRANSAELIEYDLHTQQAIRTTENKYKYAKFVGVGDHGEIIAQGYRGSLKTGLFFEVVDAKSLRPKNIRIPLADNTQLFVTKAVGGGYISPITGEERYVICAGAYRGTLGATGYHPPTIIYEVSHGPISDTNDRRDYNLWASFFAKGESYGSAIEFFWLHSTGIYGEGYYSNAMVLSRIVIGDVAYPDVFGGITAEPEIIEKEDLVRITMSDLDTQGRLDHLVGSEGLYIGDTTSPIDDVLWDESDGGVIIAACNHNVILKYSGRGELLWKFEHNPNWSSIFSNLMGTGHKYRGARLSGGRVAIRGAGEIIIIDTKTGKQVDSHRGDSLVTGYDSLSWTAVTTSAVIYFGRSDFEGVGVEEIVSDVADEVDAGSGDISQLREYTVDGYRQSQPSEARDVIAPLASLYQFDALDSGSSLKWVKRGNPPVAVLFPDDMVPLSKGSAIESKRREELSLPQAVAVTYADQHNNYEPTTFYRQRFKGNEGYATTRSVNKLTVEVPAAIPANTAKASADTILMSLWYGRTEHKFRLPPNALLLEPGDVVTLAIPGLYPEDVRIDEITVGAGYQVEVIATSQDSGRYTSIVETASDDTFVSQAEKARILQEIQEAIDSAEGESWTGQYDPETEAEGGHGHDTGVIESEMLTRLFVMSLPYLQETNNMNGTALLVYHALGAYRDPWRNGVIEHRPGTAPFEEVAQVPFASTHGILINELPRATEWDVFATNEELEINVALTYGDLEGVSYEEMLEGENVLAIFHNQDAVEIIQFRDAVLNEDDTYTLRGVVRGQLGTDYLALSAPVKEGSAVLLLDKDHTGAVPLPMDSLGSRQSFRGYGGNQRPEKGDMRSALVAGNEYKPWAPVHLTAEVSSGGDIDITWIRRTRLNGGLRNRTGNVPLSELSERYEIDVLIGNNVVRTLTSNQENVTYTAAQRDEDDTADIVGSIEFHVYQISDVVGRGHKGVVTTKGVDYEVVQFNAGLMYEIGRPDYEVGQQNAVLLQSLTVELRAAQQSMVVLHEHPYLPDIQVAQHSALAMHEPIHGYSQVAQSTNVILHEVDI